MSQNQSTSGPSELRIERPLCPNCQTNMSLARIMPGIPGFDLRYFECSHCGQILTETVALGPVKQHDDAIWSFKGQKPRE
jgi:hypothetical protein